MFNCPNTYAHINEWNELVEAANNKMGHSVVLSHIHLLIILANVLTPQPAEQFCLYCSNTYGRYCVCIYIYIYIYIYVYMCVYIYIYIYIYI